MAFLKRIIFAKAISPRFNSVLTNVTRLLHMNKTTHQMSNPVCKLPLPRVDITAEDAAGAIKRGIAGPYEMARANSAQRPGDALYYNEANLTYKRIS